MNLLKLLTGPKTMLILIVMFSFGAGGASLYYTKYRPIRNDYIAVKAVNKELLKQMQTQKVVIDSLWADYSKLAGVPKYSIKQYLSGIKVKRNASLEFVPEALMAVADSIDRKISDSIAPVYRDTTTLILKEQTNTKYRKYWWQLWRKKPPNKDKE